VNLKENGMDAKTKSANDESRVTSHEKGRPPHLPDAASAIDSEIIVGQKSAARFADVSQKTLWRWEKKGLPTSLRDRCKTYRKGDLKLYANAEEIKPDPHREREKIASADIKDIKAKLLDYELKSKQGEYIARQDVEQKSIAQITMVKRALTGQGRKLAPLLRAAGGDLKQLQSIIDTDNRQILESFAAGIRNWPQSHQGTKDNFRFLIKNLGA
jgi:DNA-binding transcriptional MerR regulator